MTGRSDEAMPYVGGHGLCHGKQPQHRTRPSVSGCSVRCGSGGTGMMQDGRPQGRRFVLRHAGKDATEGKTGRRQAAAFPFLAKVGL